MELLGIDQSQGVDQLAEQLYEAYGADGAYRALSQLLGYEEMPPSVQQFIDDSDWLGDIIGSNIYWPWRKGLYDIFPNALYSPYSEIICTGCIGSGKSTFGKIGALYDIIKLCYLKSPQDKFGLLPTQKIAYAVINATLNLTGEVLFEELIQWINESPSIRALTNKSQRTMFPKNIDFSVGSRVTHTLGQAIVGSIMDEMNFQDRVANQAMDNYLSIKRRIESRFFQQGSYAAHVWLLSSKKNETDFLDTHISKVRDHKNTKIFEYAIWDIHKYKKGVEYSGETFKIFVGDEHRDPRILEGTDTYGLPGERIIDVPVEYKESFRYDIFNAIRDLAGYSLSTSFKFIPSVELISRALILPNPMEKEVVQLDFHTESDRLINYVKTDRLVLPQYKYNPRFIHIDMAKNHDRLGIASTFVSNQKSIRRRDPYSGIIMDVTEPQFITEFVIAIEAKPGSEIPFYKIKNFIFDLIDRRYPLSKVTTDGFQSDNLRQDLTRGGINAQLLSVDRNRNAYDNMKQAMIEFRSLMPNHSILDNELRDIRDVGNKIDHSDEGTKDISDAVAGSMYASYQNFSDYPTANQIIANMNRTNKLKENQWVPIEDQS